MRDQTYYFFTLTSQQNWRRIQPLRKSLTLRIISTSVLIFVCYCTIGLQLAVVPGFVHWQLGYNAVLAGLAISAQSRTSLRTTRFRQHLRARCDHYPRAVTRAVDER